MTRKISALTALLILAGCGNFGSSSDPLNPGVELRELMVIPNFLSDSLTIKEVGLKSGLTKVLNPAVPSYGTHPVLVRSHPSLKVFYVVNRDSNVITQFALDVTGGNRLLSSISCPSQTQFLLIHPSGGWAYAAGGGILRTYSVSSEGVLKVQGGDVLLAADCGWDGDFSRNGEVLHIPEVGRIQSFVLNQGNPIQSVDSALASQRDVAMDLDVRPGGTSMAVSVQGNDSVRTYHLDQSGFPGAVTVHNLRFRPTTGDFAFNGQYYLGENASPSVHSYNSSASSGQLTELSDSPLALPGTGGSFFTALDLTEDFVFSTDASSNDRLDVRSRSADGNLVGGGSDNQGLNTPGKFDFILFQLTP
ncbi:hypothetical protein JST97_05085 [bacterium]|nr:hypothetical protein [bacterium]